MNIHLKNVDAKPKGSIIIRQITQLKNEKDKMFSIIYPDRNFQLKAANFEQKEVWMSTLEFLRNYKGVETEEIKTELSKDPPIQEKNRNNSNELEKAKPGSLSKVLSFVKLLFFPKKNRRKSKKNGKTLMKINCI